MLTKTSAEAQKQFGLLLDTVQREPVVITRHGRPAALIVSAENMDDLLEIQERRHRKLAADWDAWRKKAKKSMTPAAAALTDEEVNRMVHDLR
jgi:prevent-host-death family protein